MKFITITASLALASAAAAAATSELTRVKRDASSDSTCLQQSDAEDIVAKFITVMEHADMKKANETVQDLLNDSFFETSDSINSLAGDPLGTISFPNKVAYVAAILNAPAPHNVTTIKVLVAGCSNIVWQWRMKIGNNAAPVQGFNLMEVDSNHKLAGQYVEFNSFAWGADTGFTVLNRAGKRFPLPGQSPTNASTTARPASGAISTRSNPILPLLVATVLGSWIACL